VPKTKEDALREEAFDYFHSVGISPTEEEIEEYVETERDREFPCPDCGEFGFCDC
jgi:hypothetical protein